MRQNAHNLLHPHAPFFMCATLSRGSALDDGQELGIEPRQPGLGSQLKPSPKDIRGIMSQT
jgi:hypothetical protein